MKTFKEYLTEKVDFDKDYPYAFISKALAYGGGDALWVRTERDKYNIYAVDQKTEWVKDPLFNKDASIPFHTINSNLKITKRFTREEFEEWAMTELL